MVDRYSKSCEQGWPSLRKAELIYMIFCHFPRWSMLDVVKSHSLHLRSRVYQQLSCFNLTPALKSLILWKNAGKKKKAAFPGEHDTCNLVLMTTIYILKSITLFLTSQLYAAQFQHVCLFLLISKQFIA